MLSRNRNVRIANSGAAIDALSRLGIKEDTVVMNSSTILVMQVLVQFGWMFKIIQTTGPSSLLTMVVEFLLFVQRPTIRVSSKPSDMLDAFLFQQVNNPQDGSGFGLTQTAFCLSERTVVYSKSLEVNGGVSSLTRVGYERHLDNSSWKI